MSAAASPAAAAVFAQCAELSADERGELLALLGASAVLVPFREGEPGAPSSGRPTWPAAIAWRGDGEVTGCPWCRRPLELRGQLDLHPVLERGGPCAYAAVLYGPRCHRYFLGALVLGWGLGRHGGANVARVLLYTADVPASYISVLGASGWRCERVEYLSGVAGSFFHNWRTSRFLDVFTKLRVLQLVSFDKVLLMDIDLLVRSPQFPCAGMDPTGIDSVFNLAPPAAMKRGPPVPRHGEYVPYCKLWSHPERRQGDKIPVHQQASGINAGVVLLRPDADVFAQVEAEVRDWLHPEHYATYMPEQEYIGRFFGTFGRWTHMDCRFNFEIDKRERVPHDWTEAHEAVASGCAHPGAVVLHYSGSGVKPWDLLFGKKYEDASLCVASAAGVDGFLSLLASQGPGDRLEGYADVARLWAAMLEWLGQLAEVSRALSAQGCDALALIRSAVDADVAEDAAKADAKAAAGSWKTSAWTSS